MGEVIAASAAVERVESHIREALENARGSAGESAAAGEARLAASVARIDAARAAMEATRAAEAAAWRTLASADEHADAAIASVRDAMWNALGRARHHPAMDQVFPGGIHTYSAGDPREQPLLMMVLKSRIEAVAAPESWSPEQRNAWAAEIEATRAPLAAAIEAHRPVDAASTVAEATYRAAVRAGHAQLVKLKRDLKNLGLTEKQIHAIIPDASRPSPNASKTAKKKATEPAA